MSNINDLISDFKCNLFEQIVDSAIFRTDMEYKINKDKDFSPEIMNKWYSKLWGYDITKWKPCIDDRAFPDTHYDNKLSDVLEFRSYELRSEIMNYIIEKYKKK